jgi:hypothetical protein
LRWRLVCFEGWNGYEESVAQVSAGTRPLKENSDSCIGGLFKLTCWLFRWACTV